MNGPLKHWLSEEWARIQTSPLLGPTERRQRIRQLIEGSWDRVNEETVVNSFRRLMVGSLGEDADFEEVELHLENGEAELSTHDIIN